MQSTWDSHPLKFFEKKKFMSRENDINIRPSEEQNLRIKEIIKGKLDKYKQWQQKGKSKIITKNLNSKQ